MADWSVRLSISDSDTYDSSLRFDYDTLNESDKAAISSAIDDLTSAMDDIRDRVIG